MATFDFDRGNQWVIVDEPDTSATVQEIYNACKDYEDLPESMAFEVLCSAVGKADLGAGRLTVITLTMLNGWKVKFADRAGPGETVCYITDGNLVGDGYFPVADAANVHTVISQATTGAMLETGVSGLTAAESAQLAIIDTLTKVFVNKMITDPSTGQMIIYDDDDNTILLSGDIWEDVAGTQEYRGKGIERRDRLQ